MEEKVVEVLIPGRDGGHELQVDVKKRFLSVYPSNFWPSILLEFIY